MKNQNPVARALVLAAAFVISTTSLAVAQDAPAAAAAPAAKPFTPEIYVGPAFGGGIEIWFGYVLVLFVLLIRPQGLFGEKIIDRV